MLCVRLINVDNFDINLNHCSALAGIKSPQVGFMSTKNSDQIWTEPFYDFFKPPPPVGAGGGYMFSGHPSVRASVRASVRP